MIRPATENDAAELATLLQTLQDDLPRLAGESFEVARARVEVALAAPADQMLLVVEMGEMVTGFVHTVWQPSLLREGGEGFVTALFVRPEYRGRGFGQALLDETRAEAERRGCSRLMLLNMRNRASYGRGFYAKQGWKERPEAANFVLELERKA